MKILQDDLTHPKVQELIAYHQQNMLDDSPPGTSFALDLSELLHADITVWTAWVDDAVLGCVAMKELSPAWAEIKSMRAHPYFVGKGIGRKLMDHIIEIAHTRRYKKLSLETGTGPTFYPAIELYARNGFKLGDVFGDYIISPYNIYMHRDI